MAKRNEKTELRGSEVKIKKYFYVLRPLPFCHIEIMIDAGFRRKGADFQFSKLFSRWESFIIKTEWKNGIAGQWSED
jgi:predicted nucleotidyltransferase